MREDDKQGTDMDKEVRERIVRSKSKALGQELAAVERPE